MVAPGQFRHWFCLSKVNFMLKNFKIMKHLSGKLRDKHYSQVLIIPGKPFLGFSLSLAGLK